jgi:hypothetical protein
MTISSNGKLLLAATRELMLKWNDTKESWQDMKNREFEQKYLNDLLTAADRAGAVFDDLNKLMEKVRSECE